MENKEDKREKEGTLPPTWIWSWGAGTHGQLASGDFSDHLEPLQVTSFATELNASYHLKILDIVGGGAHGVAILGCEGYGQPMTWGSGQSGALGHGDDIDVSIPKLVKYFKGIQIRFVGAGWNHSAFVSYSGEIYTCGNGSFGQLGHGDFNTCLVPSKIETLSCKGVSMVACGMRHTLVLATGKYGDPEVYGFGSCKRGQLGIGTLDDLKTKQPNLEILGNISIPQRIIGLRGQQIMLLAANGDHSAALSEDGRLYLWGRGFNGTLDDFLPIQVGNSMQFSKLALGWNHGIALADGQLWAWGNNDRGQLGVLKALVSKTASCSLKNDISQGVLDKDQVVVEDKLGVESCALGNQGLEMMRVSGLDGKLVRWLSAGAEHSTIVLEDGKIMVWGWGEHGQLGLGTIQDQLYPEVVQIPSSPLGREIYWRTFCGSAFSFAIAEKYVQI